jgi:hypothetical protein
MPLGYNNSSLIGLVSKILENLLLGLQTVKKCTYCFRLLLIHL